MPELSTTLLIDDLVSLEALYESVKKAVTAYAPQYLHCLGDDEGVPVIQLSGVGFKGHIAYMPFPLPDDVWRGKVETSFLLPGGEADITDHKSHIMIHLEADNDKKAVVAAAKALSSLSLALNPTVIYWLPGEVYAKGDVFEKMMLSLVNSGYLPVPLWCQIHPHKVSDTHFSALTYGLAPFLGFDLMLPARAVTTVTDLINGSIPILDFFLEHDKVLKEGDTLGLGDDSKLVRLESVGRTAQGPVFGLKFL